MENSAHGRILSVFAAMENCATPAYNHGGGSLDFGTLATSARSLAAEIAVAQPGDRSPVVIYGHKDRRFLIAYWACLLSGRAAVPAEPDLSDRRLAGIVMSTYSTLLLNAQDDDHTAPAISVKLWMPVPIVAAPDCRSAEPSRAADDDTAYILFSTGTTGEPKGIEISYANLADFIGWIDELGRNIGNPGCISGNVRYCFDVSLFEMWLSWLNLQPISGLDHGDIWNVGKYLHQFKEDRLSVWVSTPTLAIHYVRHKDFTSAILPGLKAMVFCGEILPKSLVRTLFIRFPGVRIFNTYGPTECTVAVTWVEITRVHLDADLPLPIGMVRSGTWISMAAQDGAMGELVIHGASVGKGYIGASAAQSAKFGAPKEYRTGDWGKQDDGGNWYFHGRRDREIKLNGHRIDLNVVEATIRDCSGVADVIVALPADDSRMNGLRAFVLGVDTPEALSAIAIDAATRLEPHVVPRFWYGQENCVFNASAKLDRQASQAEMLLRGARYVYTAGRQPDGSAAKQDAS